MSMGLVCAEPGLDDASREAKPSLAAQPGSAAFIQQFIHGADMRQRAAKLTASSD
jgi:hypothetical protein